MNNIQINTVHPKNNKGTYISYSTTLKPSDHTLTGGFTASDAETKEAFSDNQDWNGFKKLVIKRVKQDVDNFDTTK